jgi:putative flippase GtrA
MQRPERVLVLGAGTALSPIVEVIVDPWNPHPRHWLAVVALLLIAVLSHGTALQRLSSLLATLDGKKRRKLSVTRPLKSLGASAIATAIDLAVATSVLRLSGTHPSFATAVGCVAGAVVSFSLCRAWAFEARGAVARQLGRYAFVSASGAALNAGGVALLFMLDAPFLVAWVITRAAVFATWSYPAQRDFVFATPTPRSMTFTTREARLTEASEVKSRPRLPNPRPLGGRG